MDDIIEEVKGLKADGYQEITLLGQNVNSYGKVLNIVLLYIFYPLIPRYTFFI